MPKKGDGVKVGLFSLVERGRAKYFRHSRPHIFLTKRARLSARFVTAEVLHGGN